MIKKIILENFQVYKECEVDLKEGINLFIGETNEGKSTLANRSLEFLFFKTIVKENYINYYADECSVECLLLDPNGKEHSLKRVKNRKTSYFVVDGLKLEKSGAISGAELLKSHFNISLSELNFHSQHDSYFFIIASPSDNGKNLIKFFNMEKEWMLLGDWKEQLKITKKDVLQKSKKMDALQHQKEQLGKLNSIMDLPSIGEKFKKMSKTVENANAIFNSVHDCMFTKKPLDKYAHVNVLKQSFDSVFLSLVKTKDQLEVCGAVLQSNQCIAAYETLPAKKKTLDRLAEKCQACEYSSRDLELTISMFKAFEKIDRIEKNKLDGAVKKTKLIDEKHLLLSSSISDTKKIQDCAVDILDLKKEIKICPICGGPL